jgi:hypothetical protein
MGVSSGVAKGGEVTATGPGPQRRRGTIGACQPMKRVLQAPNLALATLWADQLGAAGIAASVQRAYTGSIAGELPPDQCLPEVWVTDDALCDPARALLLRAGSSCRTGCGPAPPATRSSTGLSSQCWNCGAEMPATG